MKKVIFFVFTFINFNFVWAGTLNPTATQAFMDQLTRDFKNPDYNKARLKFFNGITKAKLSEKELKKSLSKIEVFSNRDCDFCLTSENNNISVKNNPRSYLVTVNAKTKTFYKNTFVLNSFNEFLVQNLVPQKKTTSVIDLLIPSAMAFGPGTNRKAALLGSGFVTAFAGTVGGFLAISSAPAWIPLTFLGAAGAGIYGMYRNIRFELRLDRVRDGRVCCDMIESLDEDQKESKESLEDSLKTLQSSCIEDIDKFTSALGQNAIRSRVQVNELGEELSSDLKNLGDSSFVKESLDYFMRWEETADNIFNRCYEEKKENLKTFEIDKSSIISSSISEEGDSCRARFRQVFDAYKETPTYKVTEVTNQCRAKMREVAELEKSGDESFNGRRRQFVDELKALQDSANTEIENNSEKRSRGRSK